VSDLGGLYRAAEQKRAMLAAAGANQCALRALAARGVPSLKLSGLWPRPVSPYSRQEKAPCT
jgi:hypothetical protein